MRQLKVGLPDDLRDKLEAAAADTGRDLSAEARERLERSFLVDEAIQSLLGADTIGMALDALLALRSRP